MESPEEFVAARLEETRVSRTSGEDPDKALGGAADTGEGLGLPMMSSSNSSAEIFDEVESSSPVAKADGSSANETIEIGVADDGGMGGEGGATNLFSAGDFVWGKVKHHPWWPGQVYDSSDASEYAKRVRRREEQSVLVAYFGDRTFAWCEPSQLRPFSEGFDQMARQSISRNFVGALKEALDEIQRSLESEILGDSVFREATCHPVNAGIKEGATSPIGRVKELTIVDKFPAEMLDRLRLIACDVTGTELLEITAIRAWFSALSRWMGWRMEHPPDLADEKVHVNGASPLEASAMESIEKVAPATPASEGGGPVKRRGEAAKSSHRKKMRSLAELIAQTKEYIDKAEDELCNEEEPISVKKMDSSGRQQRNKSQATSSDSENVEVEREGGVSGRRERKRSRYLSPPYTAMIVRVHHSPFLRNGEADNPKKDLEIADTGESETVMESSQPTFLSCSSELARDGETGSAFKRDGDASAVDMLHELCRAALDSTYLKGEVSSSRVRTFFDRFRGYSYASVSDFGESGIEELRSEADDDRCNSYLQGESEPNEEFEASDHSPASSGCKSSPRRSKDVISCDTDDGRVSRSEEKSISVAQGNGSEEVEIQPRNNEAEATINGSDEAAIQLTLGSGPTVSSGKKHPLPFIKKNLEAMISALRASFPLPGKAADDSDALEPGERENLVCEMNRLLMNVDELLAGSASTGAA